MESSDSGNDIQTPEVQKTSSDSNKNEAAENEVDIVQSENPDTESMGNEKEKDEETEFLEVGDSPNSGIGSPGDRDTSNTKDLESLDLQDTTAIIKDGNGEEKMGPTSISLSTLISTIIKGTVASMDDVGKEKLGSTGHPIPLSPGEIVSSSQLQDEVLISASDNETIGGNPVKETVIQESTDEVLETSLPPAYDSVIDLRRRGPDRRARIQHRFSLSRTGTYEEPLEVPKTETINTERGKIYQCLSCKVSFKYEQDMQMHLQTHLRPRYFCPVCSKRFLNQSTLERHMVTHAQTKPFVCSICSQGFRIKSNLNRHYQRIHNSKVDTGEPRRGKTVSSIPSSNIPSPEDTLPKPNFPIPIQGKVPQSIPRSYSSSSPYRANQIPVTDFAAPQIDFHSSLRYEQASTLPDPDNTVCSTERVANFPQPQQNYDFDQSLYINTVTSDKHDPEQNEPNSSLSQSRVAPRNLDDDDSHAQLFLSRYPDIESAVDAIRRIETERLFHQELLLEELKLRRKYGLPSNSVLEDLKKEIALKEKIGDMDSLITQGGSDFGRAKALKSVKSIIDQDPMTSNTTQNSIYDTSLQIDRPGRAAYLFGGLAGHQDNEDITSRNITSDLLHRGAQGVINESQASTQLRRLSAFSTAIHSPYPPVNNKESSISLSPVSEVQFTSPQIPLESSNDLSASQRLKSFTPPFGRPRRGRRRLASLPSGLPSQYAVESEIQQSNTPFLPRKQGTPASFSKTLVHHRPSLPHIPSPALKPPPPILRPPPLPFRNQQDSSFPSVANLPPPPEYVLPSSPRCPVPKRFRPNLQQPTSTEVQRLEDLTNRTESDPMDSMRSIFDTHPAKPTQASPLNSESAPEHVDTMSNPFTMSGPPNRSIQPIQSHSSLQTQSPRSAFTLITKDTTSRPSLNPASDEADDSPLDLSSKT